MEEDTCEWCFEQASIHITSVGGELYDLCSDCVDDYLDYTGGYD